jgi:putative Holliday junction resolvase
MGIDFGLKRTGISVTDPNQIIVQGLDTVDTENLAVFLKKYALAEQIELFIVGYPFLEGAWGNKEFKVKLDKFIEQLRKDFPGTPIKLHDERNTSATAREIIRQSGKKRSQREDKRLLDKTSAVVILQEYLGHI